MNIYILWHNDRLFGVYNTKSIAKASAHHHATHRNIINAEAQLQWTGPTTGDEAATATHEGTITAHYKITGHFVVGT